MACQEMESATALPDFDTLLSESEQKLEALRPPMPCNFRFRYQGHQFVARVEEYAHEHYNLRIIGDFGGLPFTAENPAERENLLALARWGSMLQGDWRLFLTSRSHLAFFGQISLEGESFRAATAIRAIARFLIDSQPMFRLIAEQRG